MRILSLLALAASPVIATAQNYQLQLEADTVQLTQTQLTATITVSHAWFAEEGFGPVHLMAEVLSPHPTLGLLDPSAPYGADLNWGAGSTPTHLQHLWLSRQFVIDPTGDPGPPLPYALNEFVPIFQFSFSLSEQQFMDLQGQEIEITASSTSTNVLELTRDLFGWWFVTQQTPPETASASITLLVGDVTCPVDWNMDGILNSEDLFDFLNDYLVNADADFNGDSITNSEDFFEFLNMYLSPPPTC